MLSTRPPNKGHTYSTIFHLRGLHLIQLFWKFYLIRTGFTLGELVSLVKVFRLFRLERIFFGCSECGHSRYMYNILSIGRAKKSMATDFTRLHTSLCSALPCVGPKLQVSNPLFQALMFHKISSKKRGQVEENLTNC